MGFLFDMIFLYRYSSTLEMSKFSGRQGDYAYFLMLLMGTSLACMKYIGTPILSSSLLLAICTLWSFDNSEQNISFYGLINFKAKYFPIFLITFEFILSAAVPYPSLFGLAFSYAYDFLINQFVIRYGYNLLKTPILVEKLFPNAAPPPTPVGRQSQEPIPGPAPQGGYNWGRGNRLGS
ncbi:DER1-domain-containing protein [Neoconidiobolus thromboides FSU 785]|nr:DER1-domain-containing protein [Neoconidiobolus thromboides FSU 785]